MMARSEPVSNAAALPAPHGRAPSRLALAAESLAARGGLLLLAVALLVFLTLPLAMILVRSVEGRAGEFVGIANFVQYVQSPALAQSTWNTLTFACLTTLVTIPLAFLLRLRDAAQLHAVQGSVPQHRADADPRAVAARGDLVHLLFGNQGALKGMLGWFGFEPIYGMPGIVLGDDVRVVPACADDPDGGARARRCAALRGGRFARHRDLAQVLHDHAARREVRPDLGGAWWCSRWR